jgi:hypothetical protein
MGGFFCLSAARTGFCTLLGLKVGYAHSNRHFRPSLVDALPKMSIGMGVAVFILRLPGGVPYPHFLPFSTFLSVNNLLTIFFHRQFCLLWRAFCPFCVFFDFTILTTLLHLNIKRNGRHQKVKRFEPPTLPAPPSL